MSDIFFMTVRGYSWNHAEWVGQPIFSPFQPILAPIFFYIYFDNRSIPILFGTLLLGTTLCLVSIRGIRRPLLHKKSWTNKTCMYTPQIITVFWSCSGINLNDYYYCVHRENCVKEVDMLKLVVRQIFRRPIILKVLLTRKR